jgi:adenine-specific DNA-methyltransferase
MPRKPTKPTTKPKRAPRAATPPPAALDAVQSYRHAAKRKNIPPAGLASQGKLREAPKMQYEYNPHLPPVLRFDASGASDKLPDLLQTARTRALNADEAKQLAEALRVHEPWLEWAGKREKKSFEVDPVALHIHERIAAQAILKIAARENIQRSLFADPELSYREAIQFYQHDVDWTNRMILGDSLQVMASLAHREGLAGKVQMIYIDPPYGIKFASNFQPEIGKRDVKDKEADLTREPEMVKAYRDTWTLGIHSYLAYLRDRLMLAKELLADTGSIFVQIGEENLHRVRDLLDEVFQPQNYVSAITYKTSIGLGTELLDGVCNYLLWYAKDKEQAEERYHQLYRPLSLGETGATRYTRAESPATGESRLLPENEEDNPSGILSSWRPFTDQGLTSRSGSDTTRFPVFFEGEEFRPTAGGWRTGEIGMKRVLGAERVLGAGATIRFKKFFGDFGALSLTNFWDDVTGGIQSRQDPKIFVVQTATKIIERCMLMTTNPGDLILDPTCGSGTTAYVAEQWGRRWITIDTSRVALSLARQRLLTATFPFFKTKDGNGNPSQGFIYKTVPHITLKSIAQNVALDAIFARHQPILDGKLSALNAALKTVTPELRQKLQTKLSLKEKREGKKSITDADRRRWLLPRPPVGDGGTTGGWQEWQVPFDTDDDWTSELKTALTDYRAAWRAKMDEVNAAIAANAEPTDLVDQPDEIKNIVRVSGPFTMEAVMPLEESLAAESPIAGAPEEMSTFPSSLATAGEERGGGVGAEPANAEAYLDKMLRLLRADGVRFPNNKVLKFTRLEPFHGDFLHAQGEWESDDGKTHRVAVSFGPEFGPITAYQVENALRVAHRRGFDDLVLAGFSFDAEAHATIEEDPNPDVRCHLAHIRPDVNMGDLLKETPNSQIFTVFGTPRTELRKTKDGQFIVEMQGVDIYNPVDNTILPTSADKVAAWFLDSDYDGNTFCITQAFFPDKSAWEKLARALKGVVDEERFAAFSGTISLPFPAGKHKRVAVKVIDPRGNEVMSVHRLDDKDVRYDRR